MNHSAHGNLGLQHDPNMSHDSGYNNSQDNHDVWADLASFNQSPYNASPMNEYGGFALMPPPAQPSLPPDAMSRMPPPQFPAHQTQQQHQQQQHHSNLQHLHHQHQHPQQASYPHQHQHQLIQPAPSPGMTHHQLPMLNTATTTWPSQLTNPRPQGSFSTPLLAAKPGPVTTPTETPPRTSPAQDKSARKALSLEQKRAMCQYHEDHPGRRQADIGAKFGVERSTVSKVLRHKEQYLKRDKPIEPSSVRKHKSKDADFDRTLSNYVRRQIVKGAPPSDKDIMEQARMFANASGTKDSILNSLSTSWLQKFKQKHGLLPGKLTRRASETNIPDSIRMSEWEQSPQLESTEEEPAPNAMPVLSSPAGPLSPFSGTKSDEEAADAHGLGLDFSAYRLDTSRSSVISGEPRDAGPISLSASTISTTLPFSFSPDLHSAGPIPMLDTIDQDDGTIHPDMLPRSKRSNTFPTLHIDFSTTDTTPSSTHPGENATPLHSAPLTADVNTSPGAVFRSPTTDNANTAVLDTMTPHAPLTGPKHQRSATTVTASIDAAATAPSPPSHEDARRAAHVLLQYLQNSNLTGRFDQGEFSTIVQLTKKLQMLPPPPTTQQVHQTSRGGSAMTSAGLSRIPEGEGDVPMGDFNLTVGRT